VITGCDEPERPIETGGGILADDMGLGKTLTMLAAIVRTTDDANDFANHNSDDHLSGSGPTPIRSKATLVVVPTPSKLFMKSCSMETNSLRIR
jgi:SNF2 family DNA or RNA helicase